MATARVPRACVRELHPLGGDHEAFVVSGGVNLDFNIAKVQLKSS